MYPAYEKFVKSGIRNVCIHKGLFAPSLDEQFPNLRPYVDASDVGKAAKDFPQLNLIIYHSAYRQVGGSPVEALKEWEETGRISAGEKIDHGGKECAEAQSWCARCTMLLSSEPDPAAKRMGMWR
jgi:hypothetical protein